MKADLTVRQLARALRVSESTARRMLTGRDGVRNIGTRERKHLRVPVTVMRSLEAQLLDRR